MRTLIIIIILLFVILHLLNKRLTCKIENKNDNNNNNNNNNNKEGFSTSHGTVMQLMAKGRHDQYLTGPHAGDVNPLQKLLPEATRTNKLPHFYVGWYPGIPDYRRRIQYA